MIKGLHHNAYRCRDSEETRKFYEDFLGLPLVNAFKIETTMTGPKTGTGVLHSFFQLDDGSCLAFFEAPDMPFEFKDQHDFDLHIALEVEPDVLEKMFAKGKMALMPPRGGDRAQMKRMVAEAARIDAERAAARGRVSRRPAGGAR